MTFKESAGVAVIASATTTALILLAQKFITTSGASDDTPIVMAGGSMTFVTEAHHFAPDPKHPGDKFRLSHKLHKRVTQVDVLYSVQNVPAIDTVVFPPGTHHTIKIDYGNDTATLETGPTGKGLDLIAADQTKDLWSASPAGSNVINYPPTTDSISQMRIDGTAYDGPSAGNGYCALMIHYK